MNDFNHKLNHNLYKQSVWTIANQWFDSDLGRALIASDEEYLHQVLENLFGYNILQLGSYNGHELVKNTRIRRQFLLTSELQSQDSSNYTRILTDLTQLPIQNHSIDVVILAHTLEFETNPYQILREVDRVLVAEGKAIFLGFNPFSLWGIWHKYWELKSRVFNQDNNAVILPSCGHLISQRRLKEWLELLGFDAEIVKEYFYRPPINQNKILNKLQFMEQTQKWPNIIPAGAYLMIATKRVSTLTPLKQSWKFAKTLIGSDVVEPARFKLK